MTTPTLNVKSGSTFSAPSDGTGTSFTQVSQVTNNGTTVLKLADLSQPESLRTTITVTNKAAALATSIKGNPKMGRTTVVLRTPYRDSVSGKVHIKTISLELTRLPDESPTDVASRLSMFKYMVAAGSFDEAFTHGAVSI